MNVILLEKIANLGDLGETVKVKAGFGRNYLIPEHKAVSATAENVEQFETRRAELEKRAHDKLSDAQKRVAVVNKIGQLNISVLASEEGKLYGSVGTGEIVDAFKAAGVEVAKKEVSLPNGAIHELGETTVSLQLHTDVSVDITVNVTQKAE